MDRLETESEAVSCVYGSAKKECSRALKARVTNLQTQYKAVFCVFSFGNPMSGFVIAIKSLETNFFYQKLSKSNLLLQENDDVFFSLAKDFVRRDLQK